jgi:uncharacterized protein
MVFFRARIPKSLDSRAPVLSMNMITLLLISIPVGFLGSLTGLGGASILVPLLVFLGVPVKIAIASAMVSVVATSSGSASAYVRERLANVRIAMYLEMFTSIGAIVGASITTWIRPVYLYYFFAFFLMTSFLKVRRNRVATSTGQGRLSAWLDLNGSYFDQATKETVHYQADHPILGGFGMMVAGLAAGMLGIGAGAFKVTVQENLLRLPPKVASTTSNFIIGMTALAGTSVYLFTGLLNVTLMAPMAVGTTIGAIAGGRVLNRLNARFLRILFFCIVLSLILQMLYKGIWS